MEHALPSDAALPLRERKKLQAMRRIQEAAIELVETLGYDNITVDSIAARADVSPSSVYRYFDTKEGVFLWDEYDPSLLTEFSNLMGTQSPLSALRTAIHRVVGARYEEDKERVLRQLRVIYSVPALERALNTQTAELRHMLSAIIATGTGRPETDLEITAVAAAVTGALIATIEAWVEIEGTRALTEMMDETLDLLARGLKL